MSIRRLCIEARSQMYRRQLELHRCPTSACRSILEIKRSFMRTLYEDLPHGAAARMNKSTSRCYYWTIIRARYHLRPPKRTRHISYQVPTYGKSGRDIATSLRINHHRRHRFSKTRTEEKNTHLKKRKRKPPTFYRPLRCRPPPPPPAAMTGARRRIPFACASGIAGAGIAA